jgi:hypothetical protein
VYVCHAFAAANKRSRAWAIGNRLRRRKLTRKKSDRGWMSKDHVRGNRTTRLGTSRESHVEFPCVERDDCAGQESRCAGAEEEFFSAPSAVGATWSLADRQRSLMDRFSTDEEQIYAGAKRRVSRGALRARSGSWWRWHGIADRRQLPAKRRIRQEARCILGSPPTSSQLK